ncbi:hypothetical protein PSTG_12576 [Puccinia striiformis f. sp. tritici PST-78]|uniref:U6 small nuclear RNA (adenine-(43)-N(6))-methyltransferase n=1 Tax=Puccinia striiformis f. sp. tritici PST-78 TaxID=1165861 RepID=A0A0L0V443_9BASI|nr:hypothetical protein PSTG_12576 [Puccinia striiformis f. sp. tritici PST-78]
MHPDNLYANQPFALESLSGFKSNSKHTSSGDLDRTKIDFKDPVQLRQLTCGLLLKDFHIKLSLPANRLCPMVPGRLDYCLWIIDVLRASVELTDGGTGVLVIDIGTGSSAIYPLLLSRLLKNAQVIATEIDQSSFDSALQNITKNDLSNRITLHKTKSSDTTILPIQLVTEETNSKISITMCNPPFYRSQDEIEDLRSKKAFPPEAVCTGSEVEMVYPGGEVGFIEKLITDSLIIGSQTRWFTSLCGKYTTLSPIVHLFKSLGGDNYAISELIQGRTRRWVIGWSWQHHRLPDNITRALGPAGPRLKDSSQFLPLSNHLEYYFPMNVAVFQKGQSLTEQIKTTLQLLKMCRFDQFQTDDPSCSCFWEITLYEKNWTRSARRKRKNLATEATSDHQIPTKDVNSGSLRKSEDLDLLKPLDQDPILKVKITLDQYHPTPWMEKNQCVKDKKSPIIGSPKETSSSSDIIITPIEKPIGYKISIDWVFGKDRDSFLSFWNHVLNKTKSLSTVH